MIKGLINITADKNSRHTDSLSEYAVLGSLAQEKIAAHVVWVLSNIAANYSVFITIIYPSLASLMYRQSGGVQAGELSA